jgi:serine/threonine protein kinase/ATP/maltotriose-dependent transcriptional regulator MalT
MERVFANQDGGLPIGAVVWIARGVGAALRRLHGADIVHADVRPSTIWRDRTRPFVLLSGGSSVRGPDWVLPWAPSEVQRSPYLAPEVRRPSDYSQQSDWYAYGAVLYQAITGQPPQTPDPPPTDKRKRRSHPPPAPITLRPDCPAALNALIVGLLSPKPTDRVPFIDQIESTLQRPHDRGPTPPGPTASPEPPVSPAPSTPENEPLPIGTIVDGRYRVDALVFFHGRRGSYRARDLLLEADRGLITYRTDEASPQERHQIDSAIAALATVGEHPALMTIHHAGYDGDYFFMSVPWRDSEHLAAVLHARQTGLPFDEIIPVARTVSSALRALHAAEITHGGVRPATVWRVLDGARAVLLVHGTTIRGKDWALPWMPTKVRPTPYIAPEIRRPGEHTASSDWYAFGALLYEIVTGQPPPFAVGTTDGNRKRRAKPPPAPTSLRPECPEALNDLILGLLSSDPDDRLPFVHEIATVLDQLHQQNHPSRSATTETDAGSDALIAGLAQTAAAASTITTEQRLAFITQLRDSLTAQPRHAARLLSLLEDAAAAFAAAGDAAAAADARLVIVEYLLQPGPELNIQRAEQQLDTCRSSVANDAPDDQQARIELAGAVIAVWRIDVEQGLPATERLEPWAGRIGGPVLAAKTLAIRAYFRCMSGDLANGFRDLHTAVRAVDDPKAEAARTFVDMISAFVLWTLRDLRGIEFSLQRHPVAGRDHPQEDGPYHRAGTALAASDASGLNALFQIIGGEQTDSIDRWNTIADWAGATTNHLCTWAMLIDRGILQRVRGHLDAAARDLATVAEEAQRHGVHTFEILAQAELAATHARRIDTNAARIALDRIDEIATTSPRAHWRGLNGLVRSAQAELAWLDGANERGDDRIQEALQLLERYGRRARYAESLTAWAAAISQRGSPLQALEKLDEAEEQYVRDARITGRPIEGLAAIATLRNTCQQQIDATRQTAAHSASTRPLVGRRDVLDAARVDLDSVADGQGHSLLLHGESGIGKTRIVNELEVDATTRGFRVVRGQCDEFHRDQPYSPWVQILTALTHEIDGDTLTTILSPDQRGLTDLVPTLRKRIGGDLDNVGAVHTPSPADLLIDVQRIMANRAAYKPLLVILEDIHWADDASLAVLRDAAHQLQSDRIYLVATLDDTYSDRPSDVANTIAILDRTPGSRRIHLPPLTRPEVADFLTQIVHEQPQDWIIAEIFALTNGNPFYVRELGDYLSANLLQWWRGTVVVVPDALREVVERRLARLSDDSRALLTDAAVLGTHFDVRTLQAVAAGEPNLTPLLAEAVAAGIISQSGAARNAYAFNHGVVQRVLYDRIDPDNRVHAHQRAIIAIETLNGTNHGARLAALARHHYASWTIGGARAAINVLAQTGEGELAQHDVDRAERAFRQALEIADAARDVSADGHLRALIGLAVVHITTGHEPDATDLLRKAAELVIGRGALAPFHGPPSPASPDSTSGVRDTTPILAALQATVDANPTADTALRAVSMAHIAAAQLDRTTNPDQRRAALQHSADAVAMARRTGDQSALAATLALHTRTHLEPDAIAEREHDARELVAVAAVVGNASLLVAGRLVIARTALAQGDIFSASSELLAVEPDLARLPNPLFSHATALIQAEMRLLEGAFAEAEALIHHLTDAPHSSAAERHGAAILTRAAILRGQLTVGAPDVTAMRRWAPTSAAAAARTAEIALALGNQAEARTLLDELRDQQFQTVPWDHSRLPTLASLAETCAALNDADIAPALIDLLLPYQDANATGWGVYGSVHHHLGILYRTISDDTTAIQHLERARDANGAIGARPQLAWTELELAKLDNRTSGTVDDGDRNRMASLLTTSHQTASALKLMPLIDALNRFSASVEDKLGNGVARPYLLSRRERQVMRFIVQGKKNREMAETMTLSVHTVERHVQNLYRKLGVRSRAEATAFALEHKLV